ncbi:MAG: M1 family metallopeptidase, partial [Chitinophagaceae bacterium]|nr:M1 family metallopeptidase [Chitinophagaceae bacterium]
MKYFFVLLIAMCKLSLVIGQSTYWQQQVNYKITVTLNDREHSLDAFEKITYTNNSPDTLRFIWFHIWPNAYKNDRTAFAEQTLKNGSSAFYFSADSSKGYINQLDFKVDDVAAVTEEHPNYIDIIKLLLPKPLPPNETINIATPFHVQLPYNFSRGGHIGQSYQITQWYPKPAVYDSKGWHEMPYLDQGEFYSEFGNFDVKITLPANYIVAASGELQDKNELDKLKALGKIEPSLQNNNAAYASIKKQQKKIIAGTSKKVKSNPTIIFAAPIKTLQYKLDSCHDFAWFADKEFIVQYDTVALLQKTVDVFSYYHPTMMGNWKKSTEYAKDGLKKYSQWIGEYPYSIASIVSGASNENSGGMEYPTITLITTQMGGQPLDGTIVHELGHNWFYGALASNERDHAWMDESMNNFYQKRYEAEKYPTHTPTKNNFFSNRMPIDAEMLAVAAFEGVKKDQHIDTLSPAYSSLNYALMVYAKGSKWMKLLEQDLTLATFDKAMQSYYNQWKFKHPYPEDFKK